MYKRGLDENNSSDSDSKRHKPHVEGLNASTRNDLTTFQKSLDESLRATDDASQAAGTKGQLNENERGDAGGLDKRASENRDEKIVEDRGRSEETSARDLTNATSNLPEEDGLSHEGGSETENKASDDRPSDDRTDRENVIRIDSDSNGGSSDIEMQGGSGLSFGVAFDPDGGNEIIDVEEASRVNIEAFTSDVRKFNGDGIMIENPSQVPQDLRQLNSSWFVFAVLHTWIEVTEAEVYTECLKRATIQPLTSRLQVGTCVEEGKWIALLCVRPQENPETLLFTGEFPPVASAILEVCMTHLVCAVRVVSLNGQRCARGSGQPTTDVTPHPLVFIPPTNDDVQRVPITLNLYSPQPGLHLGELLFNRVWAEYISSYNTLHQLAQGVETACGSVQKEFLSPWIYSVNLFCDDSLLCVLTRRETAQTPNLDYAFTPRTPGGTERASIWKELRSLASSLWSALLINNRRDLRAYSALPWGTDEQAASDLQIFEPYSDNEVIERIPVDRVHDVETGMWPSDWRQEAETWRQEVEVVDDDTQTELESWREERLEWQRQAVTSDLMPMCGETPYRVKIRLLPHQRRGVYWMKERETSPRIDLSHYHLVEAREADEDLWCDLVKGEKRLLSMREVTSHMVHGGILADDMGMGKTIQTLALIAGDREEDEQSAEGEGVKQRENKNMKICDEAGRRLGGTLILCPVNMIGEWHRMIEESSEIREVLDYHGTQRHAFTSGSLAAAEIVLCSYATLATDVYANLSKREKTKAKHDPFSYKAEGKDMGKPSGKKKASPGESEDTPSNSMLGRIHWRRIVLDEAHEIRNIKSRKTSAILTLTGDYKWALTGTPIQNKIKDLQPIFQFLHLAPYTSAQTFSKAFPTGSERLIRIATGGLLLRRMKTELHSTPQLSPLPHNIRTDAETATENEDQSDASRETPGDITTADGPTDKAADDILGGLPRKRVYMLRVELSEDERIAYDLMRSATKEVVSQLGIGGEGGGSFVVLSALATQLRLLSSTSAILKERAYKLLEALTEEAHKSAANVSEEALKKLAARLVSSADMQALLHGRSEEDVCPICLEPDVDTLTECQHLFHRQCITQWLSSGHTHCPTCRASTGTEKIVDFRLLKSYVRSKETAARNKEAAANDQGTAERTLTTGAEAASRNASSKVKVICDRVATQLQRQLPDGKPTKIVLFSNFVRLLRHLHIFLKRRDIECQFLIGEMNRQQRAVSISTFQRSPRPMVMLASLTAASLGVTLTGAHIVYLCDPWWNPHVEEQAVDRVHRIGQTREVEVYRVISVNTIEQLIVDTQTQKRNIASRVLTGRAADSHAATVTADDLRDLLLR